jgi:hypothetical protein
MREFVYKIGAAGLTRDQAREIRQGKPPVRNFTYQHDDPNNEWSLTIKFKRPEATSQEVRNALEETLGEIES